MKTNNTIRPAIQRAKRHPQKAQRLKPTAQGRARDPEPNRLPPTGQHHDFLALCFYPGMGDRSTAA